MSKILFFYKIVSEASDVHFQIMYIYLNFPAKNERLHFGAKIQLKLFKCNMNTLYFDYFLFYFYTQIELRDKM